MTWIEARRRRSLVPIHGWCMHPEDSPWSMEDVAQIGAIPVLTGSAASLTVTTVVHGVPLGGNFSVLVNDATTTPLASSSSALEMQDALSAVLDGSISVSRDGPFGNGGFEWYITFSSEFGDLVQAANTSGLIPRCPCGGLRTNKWRRRHGHPGHGSRTFLRYDALGRAQGI